jgi:hypothetical protein
VPVTRAAAPALRTIALSKAYGFAFAFAAISVFRIVRPDVLE